MQSSETNQSKNDDKKSKLENAIQSLLNFDAEDHGVVKIFKLNVIKNKKKLEKYMDAALTGIGITFIQ